MSESNSALSRKRLPIKPSEEHLRKQAKRRVKLDPKLQLADAQHQLAKEYGCKSWPELMHVVETMNRGADQLAYVKYEMEALPEGCQCERHREGARDTDLGEFTQHDWIWRWHGRCCGSKSAATSRGSCWNTARILTGNMVPIMGRLFLWTGECLDPDGLQFLIDAGANVTFEPIDTKYGRQCPLSHFLGTYVRGQNEPKHRGIEILRKAGAYVPPEVSPSILAIHAGDAMKLADLLDSDPSLGETPLRGYAVGQRRACRGNASSLRRGILRDPMHRWSC